MAGGVNRFVVEENLTVTKDCAQLTAGVSEEIFGHLKSRGVLFGTSGFFRSPRLGGNVWLKEFTALREVEQHPRHLNRLSPSRAVGHSSRDEDGPLLTIWAREGELTRIKLGRPY